MHDSAQSQPDNDDVRLTSSVPSPASASSQKGHPGQSTTDTDSREKDRPQAATAAHQLHAQPELNAGQGEELNSIGQEESHPAEAQKDAARQEQTGDRGRQLAHWLEGGIVYVQVIRAKGLKSRSFNIFGLSILM